MIWGGSNGTGGGLLIKGGTGNDHVYGGFGTMGITRLYGNAGKDVVRSDWYNQDQLRSGSINPGNEYLFGDYKYGTDALDKDLHGDDDIIYGGFGRNAQGARQHIYGGDGNDELHGGYSWGHQKIYGQNGDDTIYAPQEVNRQFFIYGGEGDDEVLRTTEYGDLVFRARNVREY